MPYLNKELAQRMESCIKQTHIEMANSYAKGRVLEIDGGAACFSGFDSFFSQVVGWGFATQPKYFQAQILTIERFYQSLNYPRVDIELCPFVGKELVHFLSQRNYKVTELNNVSFIDLNAYQMIDGSDEFKIARLAEQDLDLWAKKIAQAFGYPEAQRQFASYSRLSGVHVFGGYIADELAAGATIAIHEGVGDLGVTSTLAAHRGKGLQKQLVRARLNFAKQQGLSLAIVTTEPGTISDLNIQKAGFHTAYTRLKMTRELPK